MSSPNRENRRAKKAKTSTTERMATAAIMAGLALIFSYVEAIIPMPVGIPGVKLGIANLVVLIALYKLNIRYALGINLVRISVNGLLFTGLSGAIYALAGGLFSLLVMALLKKTGLFSVIGVSMAGGVMHNIGQLIVAGFVISNMRIFVYLPVLMFSGIISGIVIGILAWYVMRILP